MSEPPRLAGDVVSGLKQNPAILAIVVLNLIAIGAGVWFMREVSANARATTGQLLTMMERCLDGRGDAMR
jgi:hypothetical protein